MSQRPRAVPLILNPTGIQRFRMINRRGGSGIRITSIQTIRAPDKQTHNKVIQLSEQETIDLTSDKPKLITLPDTKIIKLPDTQVIKLPDKQIIKLPEKLTIKPLEVKTKEQEEEELRIQVQKEIEQRARLCEHPNYECSIPCFLEYNYCPRHILDDPLAPFQQCTHIYGSGEKCHLPAPVPSVGDNRKDAGLCFEHTSEALHGRQRSAAAPPHVTTTETLLTQLQHYVNSERARTTSCASSVSIVSDPADIDVPGVPVTVDPFKQIDAIAINKSVTRSIMDCASESDSDADSITLGKGGNCRAGEEENELEPEYVNLSQPLRLCGVYTAEEAVNEAKDTLKVLYEAYQRQMGRLRYLLHDARADYLRDLKTEKEQYCSINTQARSGPTVKERKQLRKLKAFASYHKKHGADAILYRKLLKKRSKAHESHSSKTTIIHNRCTFMDESLRCSELSLPASKHCMKHILHDQQQVLFVACGDHRGPTGLPCAEPIARLPMHSMSCRYHTDPPSYTMFSLKKDDSESEQESDYTIMEEPQEIQPNVVEESPELVIEEIPMDYPLQDDIIMPEDLDIDLDKPNT